MAGLDGVTWELEPLGTATAIVCPPMIIVNNPGAYLFNVTLKGADAPTWMVEGPGAAVYGMAMTHCPADVNCTEAGWPPTSAPAEALVGRFEPKTSTLAPGEMDAVLVAPFNTDVITVGRGGVRAKRLI